MKNLIYLGSNNRESLIDFEIPENFNGEIIVFVHGFMGFKDWGAWNLVQDFFTRNGFGFCKFNLSHNGGTIENGIDFPDENAFGSNTYSKELNDVISVLNWIEKQKVSYQKIHLIGHSRGGGIALLAANMDTRISSVTSWAGISDIGSRFPIGKELEEWKNSGVRFVQNGRTKQNLPQFYLLYEDFIHNQDKLNIGKACENLKIPACVIHGSNDISVPLHEGELNAKRLNVPLQIIENADHVFGASQPWNSNDLPADLKKVCRITLNHLKT
ncbi:MAG: alpha/beta hydrolase family protein [Bacteroidota bacterium]